MSQGTLHLKRSNKPVSTRGSEGAKVSNESKRDQYVKKMKKQLTQLNAKLDEVEADSRQFSTETRKKLEQQMTHLRELAKSANKQFEHFKGASEDQWDRLVREGDKIQKAFIHSYNYFKSQLK